MAQKNNPKGQKNRNGIPKYRKKPNAMREEMASEIGTLFYDIEDKVNVAGGGKKKLSKRASKEEMRNVNQQKERSVNDLL
ncbi:hypothetical protein SAMN05661008_00611 [Alkalithermobacter thermoalcaliphilus JW-YL-7 = DSM 7308]|uniref:Uncharacterized protein n=1 Tax=Alkalithermobacter thermoalcaliphilus JW-YL-7 = DSM 7308 TaxID=1121328 RepID=A0A150FQ21_CLOPD|nr:hypothetical protein JWYL7_0786 [[Clostridium] paradoxum JW-YL-7 = DSM 7308]SHK63796.1 hypothetical protein SAMN05661008_00611 [[Clostridium] paradoxum JW-YL-7 = DSM 7308]